MREPDVLPPPNPMDIYENSRTLANKGGFLKAWDDVFMPIFERLGMEGVEWNHKILTGVEAANKAFNIRVDGVINESDYV